MLYSVLTFCVAPWFVIHFGILLLCSHVTECFFYLTYGILSFPDILPTDTLTYRLARTTNPDCSQPALPPESQPPSQSTGNRLCHFITIFEHQMNK